MGIRLASRITALVKRGGGFASYMADIQGRCINGKRSACDGGPTAHDAHKDYQAMLDSRHLTG